MSDTEARARRLLELAQRAFPGVELQVWAPAPGGFLRVTERDTGDLFLQVRHADADRVLALLADDPAEPAVKVCLDVAERAVRDRSRGYGIDIAGFRDKGVALWTEAGKIATGASLADALENLDRRRRGESKGP